MTTENKVILLFGPTASGKTALTESVFSSGFEIVNADSIQVYRGLDIGSAKPSPALRAKLPHHLIDIRDPWQQYSVGDFVHDADKAVREIRARGNVPLISGGTAFYFRNYLYGLSKTPISNEEVRKSVRERYEAEGPALMHKFLSSVDPESAARINPNDSYRLTRAVEVYMQSGRPLSTFEKSFTVREGLDPLIIAIKREKEVLKARIALRVEMMFEEGLVDEIANLKRKGAQKEWPGMQGIGYREFFDCEECGCASFGTIKEKIKSNSVKYAKRQMTFFRSFSNAIWVDGDEEAEVKQLVDEYLSK